MRLFYFDNTHTGSALDPFQGSLCIRAAYLLADVSICTLFFDYLIRLGNATSYPFAYKEKFLAGEHYMGEVDGVLELMSNRDAIRKIRAAKIKTRADIVLLKQYEKAVEVAFDKVREGESALYGAFGYTQLAALEGEGISYCNFDEGRPDRTDDGYVPASKLLQLLGYTEDTKTVHRDVSCILGAHAMTPEGLRDHLPALPTDEDARNQDLAHAPGAWSDLLFQLPNIVGLSAAELHAVRLHLATSGAAFRAAFVEWIGGCAHDGWDAARSAAHYAANVRAAAAALRDAVAANKVLAHARATNTEMEFPVYAACAPLRLLWDYWYAAKTIDDYTFEKLRATDAERGGTLIPFLIVGAPGAGFFSMADGEVTATEDPVPAPRRTLDLS